MRAPAQRTQASSACGMASCSAGESMTLRGSQSSRNASTLAGLIRSGWPKSRSQPYSTMWSAQRLAASRSDRSSASSEARNSAMSMARRSRRQTWRRRAAVMAGGSGAAASATAPLGSTGGRVRTRARMNAW